MKIGNKGWIQGLPGAYEEDELQIPMAPDSYSSQVNIDDAWTSLLGMLFLNGDPLSLPRNIGLKDRAKIPCCSLG